MPPETDLPDAIESVEQLEELLSRPTGEVVELFKRLDGPLAIIGGGGKIGPSLVSMACRARESAGSDIEIVVVDRFPEPAARQRIEQMGAKTITCDLLDQDAVGNLPDAANVVYMVGMKFGTTDRPDLTWAVNGAIPAYVAPRYRDANVVAFSTGCVYDLVPVDSGGSKESDPLTPIGEYANSCVARERILEYFSITDEIPMVLLRLNYALDLRYGVLVDIAASIAAGKPVDVTMGHLNCIWQGDVNAATLRLLEHAATPAAAINLTGPETLSVRRLAGRMGEVMGKDVTFVGSEAETALLSNPAKAVDRLGAPQTPVDKVVEWTARWVQAGGESLGKPTHFQTRDGKY